MLPPEHNIWAMLFEQTPVVLRWVFGILSLGTFWLAKALYTNHKERVNRLEILIITRDKAVNEKLDRLIFEILDK